MKTKIKATNTPLTQPSQESKDLLKSVKAFFSLIEINTPNKQIATFLQSESASTLRSIPVFSRLIPFLPFIIQIAKIFYRILTSRKFRFVFKIMKYVNYIFKYMSLGVISFSGFIYLFYDILVLYFDLAGFILLKDKIIATIINYLSSLLSQKTPEIRPDIFSNLQSENNYTPTFIEYKIPAQDFEAAEGVSWWKYLAVGCVIVCGIGIYYYYFHSSDSGGSNPSGGDFKGKRPLTGDIFPSQDRTYLERFTSWWRDDPPKSSFPRIPTNMHDVNEAASSSTSFSSSNTVTPTNFADMDKTSTPQAGGSSPSTPQGSASIPSPQTSIQTSNSLSNTSEMNATNIATEGATVTGIDVSSIIFTLSDFQVETYANNLILWSDVYKPGVNDRASKMVSSMLEFLYKNKTPSENALQFINDGAEIFITICEKNGHPIKGGDNTELLKVLITALESHKHEYLINAKGG